MTDTEKILYLENFLATYQEKEKKNYLAWETLRKNLGVTGRKKIGLTAIATLPELKAAIEPFLGSNLMFFEHFGEWYLSFKMSLDKLRREISLEKTEYLQSLLARHQAKEKKNYMPLRLKAKELKFFGLKASPAPNASTLENALAPCLGSELKLLKRKPETSSGKETLYLARKMPLEQLVEESLQTRNLKKPFKMKEIADDIPLSKVEFVALFSRMLEAGQIQVTKIDDKFNIADLKSASVRSVPVSPPTLGPEDYDSFQKAFEKLDKGRIYVRICNMRRELGWSVEHFNCLLHKLRVESVIQLHAGNVSTMTEEDIDLSYTDENNFFYVTMTWKKR